MPKITQYVPGTFCWTDLATSDAQGAKKFYSGLFGWTFTDIPMQEGMVYSMAHLEGVDVSGISEQKDQRPHWNSYIGVEDADLVVAQAKSLGAKALAEPFDVMNAGRMAVLQDPQGAVFFLWQSRKPAGATLMGEPGTLCWNELMAHDSKKAFDFYTTLFQWKSVENEANTTMYTAFMLEGKAEVTATVYTVFMKGDKMVGGMFPLREPEKQIPSGWSVFFGVKECKEGVDKAVSLGAHVLVGPTPIENFGCFAVLRDPQGAEFGLVSVNKKE